MWVDLDERKRPKSAPRLLDWATPEGWRRGLRPRLEDSSGPGTPSGNLNAERLGELIRKVEEMADAIGKRLYRGVLKSVARVWNPTEIHDPAILQRVLTEMRSAETELCRLDDALNRVEPGTLTPILRCLRLNSLDQLDSLDSLKKIVLEIEQRANSGT